MPRLPRFDSPGRWFHVMNRGLAHRPIFESERDIRYFLSRVAYAVRRGELEVHAFCLMTTHYHMLVRSPKGQLSEAMRRIQNEYVRYFNRTRGRDGPLFRGRFLSKPVLSIFYRFVLVRYIDENPVNAGLAATPWAYAHGSAVRFASGNTPRWLCRRWVMGRVAHVAEVEPGADYASVWGRRPTLAERELVELRIRGRGVLEDGLDDLVGQTPQHVREWMLRQTRVADRTRPGITCVPPRTVLEVVERLRASGRAWRHGSRAGQRRDAWGVAIVGLLRHLSGQTHREISERVGVGIAMVARRASKHAELSKEPHYATRMGRVAALCVEAAFPHPRGKV